LEESIVTFYLEEAPENLMSIEDIRHRIDTLKSETEVRSKFSYGSLRTELNIRSDEEWKDVWKEFFKPHQLVAGLWIKPSWEEFNPPDKQDVVLELDPGMAFGTGKHETTALCANLMKDVLKPGDKVLDVGCGSGILSVTAALLGAAEVLAVDIDEDAVAVTRENVTRNNCEHIVRVIRGDLNEDIDFKSDVILANLTADLVSKLSGQVLNNMKKDADFIVSGILTAKRQQVESAIEAAGLQIIKEKVDGEWCAFWLAIQ
jgi:ribosomal protein L11 methyltransferase